MEKFNKLTTTTNPASRPCSPLPLRSSSALKKLRICLPLPGFTFTNANLADVIVSAFIENKIFDVDLVNQILYKYDQPLLGG